MPVRHLGRTKGSLKKGVRYAYIWNALCRGKAHLCKVTWFMALRDWWMPGKEQEFRHEGRADFITAIQ